MELTQPQILFCFYIKILKIFSKEISRKFFTIFSRISSLFGTPFYITYSILYYDTHSLKLSLKHNVTMPSKQSGESFPIDFSLIHKVFKSHFGQVCFLIPLISSSINPLFFKTSYKNFKYFP